ncbi:MAG: HAD family hydrolase [Nanoarchaeota archaeon]|nr:HAD family hydrolase [Nanoarchaeota archaeon]
MLKAIIFDFDGVLFDDYEEHYQAYKKRYKDMTRKLHSKAYEGNILEAKENLLKIKNKSFVVKNFLQGILMKKGIRKEALRFLKKNKKDYSYFIVTAASEDFINYYLLRKKLTNLFKMIMGKESGKYKVDKMKKFLKENKLKKNEVVFVTDTLGDIKEAKKVGIKTIAIDFGFHKRKILEKGNPYKIVSSFKELEEVILEL